MLMAKRYLVVRLAGKEFAVPAARICGMMQVRGLHLEASEGLGAAQFLARLHGRALPVYVPNQALGLPQRPVSARSCLLLIGRAGGASSNSAGAESAGFAVMVDSVSRMEEVPPSLCRPRHSSSAFAAGQIRLGEKWRDVLDLEAMPGAGRGSQRDLSRTT